MLRFVVKDQYIKLFQFIYDKDKPSIKDISKASGFQYLHTINVLRQFQQEGLIKPVFDQLDASHRSDPGNPYIIELTLKGQASHRLLNMIKRLYLDIDTEKILKQLNIQEDKK